MLKLKLQYFGHLLRKVDSFDPDEKTLVLGKTVFIDIFSQSTFLPVLSSQLKAFNKVKFKSRL